ncbi:MAG: YihY family inner membrane protein [Caldimonas sp.]|uniref:YihY family inner membrane protein n=1 Tax=Caldimonas sp. TaxID=2838790 RepID=UPI00391B4A68
MNLPKQLPLSARERLSALVRTLQDWPWLETLRTLGQRFREDRLGLTAGSLTFTTLIALVPLFTVTLAVFTAFPMFASFQAALEAYFVKSLVPEAIARPVLRALTRFAANANRLGTAGLVVLVLTALSLMLTIDRTLNALWRVRKPRPIAQRVLVYWAAATLGPLLLGVSLTLTSYALTASRGLVGSLPAPVSFFFNALEFLLMAGAFAGLFRYVPNTHVRWSDALAGGFFVATGLELAKTLLAWYLRSVPTYSALYGTFATVPIFLVWLYLGWVVVLLGGVIAAYAPSLRMKVVRRPATPGHRFHLALMVLRELQASRLQPAHGLSLEALSERLRTDPLQIEPLLEKLRALDWVGRLDEEGGARHVLLAEPEHTLAQPLVAELLLDPAPDLRGFWDKAGFGRMTLKDLLA